MNFFLIKVFIASCLGIITVPTLSQNIMSFKEYQTIDHKEPYIYQVQLNNGKLLYFGSRHSFDPDDQQMDTLAYLFHKFQPEVVFTEAYPEKFDYSLSKQEAIRAYGEFGLIWKLSDKQNIPIHTIEPARVKEIEYLKHQGWSDAQLIIYFTLKQIAQSQGQQHSLDFAVLIPRYLASLKQRFDLNGPLTLETFEKFVQLLLPEVKNWQSIPQQFFYPGPQNPEYFTNKISTDSNNFRDKHHIVVITEAVKKGRQVFVMAGSAHSVMQEPALRSILIEN